MRCLVSSGSRLPHFLFFLPPLRPSPLVCPPAWPLALDLSCSHPGRRRVNAQRTKRPQKERGTEETRVGGGEEKAWGQIRPPLRLIYHLQEKMDSFVTLHLYDTIVCMGLKVSVLPSPPRGGAIVPEYGVGQRKATTLEHTHTHLQSILFL